MAALSRAASSNRHFCPLPYRLAVLFLAITSIAAAQPGKTRNVILITADGLRWQELFSGIDPLLMSEKAAGMEDAQALRERLWRPTPEQRRKALLPFFWTELAPKGMVLGNLKRNSSVRVSNSFRVSFPGYSEILTGRAQDDVIRGNDKNQNTVPTILEFVRQKLELNKREVALFASWEVFPWIGESKPGSIMINAGYAELNEASPRMKELNLLQFRLRTPWNYVRHDYVTYEMAREHLRAASPRLMHIAFGETDNWAHNRRYDRVLESIGYFDECLRDLWEWIESTPGYKGATTLVITSDHGRGSTIDDWGSHGAKVKGAEQIWIAIAGPDTPPIGEAFEVPEVFQRDVAPTVLDLLGIDYREYAGVQGTPIRPGVRNP